MYDLLNLVARQGAAELRLQPDRPPVMVLHGKPRVIDGPLVTSDQVAELFRSIATEEQIRELDQCGDIHFSYSAQNATRFTVSATTKGGNLSLRVTWVGKLRFVAILEKADGHFTGVPS
jgi:Tfp pilus assembly ATPase PilU